MPGTPRASAAPAASSKSATRILEGGGPELGRVRLRRPGSTQRRRLAQVHQRCACWIEVQDKMSVGRLQRLNICRLPMAFGGYLGPC
jgi:hypothetical protein